MKTRLPKIELHLHLDGAIPKRLFWELAQEKGVALPVDSYAAFEQWLVQTADCRDVNAYLARFELPLQLMQDAGSIARVTRELLLELAAQGHIYDEIRFAPQLHCRAGLSQRGAIEAVLEGRAEALALLPDYDCGILLCAMSVGAASANMEQNLETVRLAPDYLGRGVAGIDLAGAEGLVPLADFRPVFDLAKELGIPFTCHAGDSGGLESIASALSFGAVRLGHGHHIYDDPALCALAIERGVTLEICPSSNIQCKTQPSYAAHPAKKLLELGMRICISTDNMTLAAVTLDDEYRHCVTEMGFTEQDLRTMNRYAAEAAFLPEEKRRRLLTRLAAEA